MKSRKTTIALITFVAFGSSYSAMARDDSPKRAPILDELVACRAIADSSARLVCYDEKVNELDLAQKNNELIVADKADIKEARKGLFGFSLPKLKLFGSGDDDEDDVKEIETVITSARQVGYGAWVLNMEDGSQWQQIGTRKLVLSPKVGSKVRIKKGAVTNYWANIDGQRAISVKRTQ